MNPDDKGIVEIATLEAPAQAALRVLNNAHARETSHLGPDEWDGLIAQAAAAWAMEDLAALLLAFDEAAVYDSPNFLWFRKRFDRFLYVDRVIVKAEARGRGRARRLYGALAALARRTGRPRLVAEVNRVPPNPVSDAFHAALGFEEVGRG